MLKSRTLEGKKKIKEKKNVAIKKHRNYEFLLFLLVQLIFPLESIQNIVNVPPTNAAK